MSTGVVGEVERLVEVDGGGGRVERAVIRVIFGVGRWYGWSNAGVASGRGRGLCGCGVGCVSL